MPIILTSCEYKFFTTIVQNQTNSNDQVNKLTVLLYNDDPFNSIIRIIRNEMHLNNIKIINSPYDDVMNIYNTSHNNIPLVYITHISENHVTTSVFQNGKEAEYQLIFQMQTKLFIPNKKNCYFINTRVHRSLINTPEEILPNIIQENEIFEDMYQDAACKLIQELSIQLSKKEQYN